MPKVFGKMMFGQLGEGIFQAQEWPKMHNVIMPVPLGELKQGENVAYDRTREVNNWHFMNTDGTPCAPAIGVRMCGDNFNSTRITKVMPDGWLLTESGAAYRPANGSRPRHDYKRWLEQNADKLVDNDVLRFMDKLYPELFKLKPVDDNGQGLMWQMKPAPKAPEKAGKGWNSMVAFYNDPNYGKEVK